MHPRLLACLLASIVAAAVSAAWCLTAGWGWIAAIFAYAVSGSVVLVAASAIALLIEEREERLAAPSPAQGMRPAPVRGQQRLV